MQVHSLFLNVVLTVGLDINKYSGVGAGLRQADLPRRHCHEVRFSSGDL